MFPLITSKTYRKYWKTGDCTFFSPYSDLRPSLDPSHSDPAWVRPTQTHWHLHGADRTTWCIGMILPWRASWTRVAHSEELTLRHEDAGAAYSPLFRLLLSCVPVCLCSLYPYLWTASVTLDSLSAGSRSCLGSSTGLSPRRLAASWLPPFTKCVAANPSCYSG